MLKRLSLLDMHVALKNLIETYTDLRCVDYVKPDEVSPFTYLEFFEKRPDNTKTMFVDKFTVHVHVISKREVNGSSIPHYENIKKIEEAFTKRMTLPEPFEIFRQANEGLVTNYVEETGERHAVIAFSFWVSYGFKVKI